MIDYVFSVGQRVSNGTLNGEVTSMVPGSGQPESEWYYVDWEDGSSDRYMRHQIYAN